MNGVLFISFLVKIYLIVKRGGNFYGFFFLNKKHIVGGIVSLDLTKYLIKVHFGVKKHCSINRGVVDCVDLITLLFALVLLPDLWHKADAI